MRQKTPRDREHRKDDNGRLQCPPQDFGRAFGR